MAMLPCQCWFRAFSRVVFWCTVLSTSLWQGKPNENTPKAWLLGQGRWSYLPKLTCEEAQAEMDEALKAIRRWGWARSRGIWGRKDGDLMWFHHEKRGWIPQINPNYGKLMMDHGKYHGVPNLEAAAAAPHVHRTIGSCQDKEKEGDWRGKGTMWILVDRFRQSLKMFEAIIISKKSPKSIRGGSTALAPAMVGGGGWRGLTRHDRWWQLGQWRMDHDDIMMQIETMGDRMS